jgi:putative transposase
LRAKLQSLGTASARRKLKKLSGAERRFTLDVNHVIAKEIIRKPYDVHTVEDLKIGRRKVNGRKFNRPLGSWS